MKNKKFISIIWGYHKQIFSFEAEQNYHMMPLQVMKDAGYECEIFSIDSQVRIEDDPNFISGVTVVYYKNIFQYLFYLWKNREAIIYSNSLTIKTLLVGMIGKKTVFYPHDNIFGRTGKNYIKKNIIIFFYRYFSKIRVNNIAEAKELNAIKKDIAYICPLVISKAFLDTSVNKREGGIFIGNLSSAKNPFFLLEACLLLQKKNIKFHINIIGEDRIGFYHQIKKYHLEDYLSILGFIPHNSIKEYLRNAEILINTSLGEGQCIAVYEGALSGCVLCVPNILSFPSVFGENALYHNSVEELSDNVILYLKDKEIFEQKIIANQNMILSEYNYTTIYGKLKQLFLGV